MWVVEGANDESAVHESGEFLAARLGKKGASGASGEVAWVRTLCRSLLRPCTLDQSGTFSAHFATVPFQVFISNVTRLTHVASEPP